MSRSPSCVRRSSLSSCQNEMPGGLLLRLPAFSSTSPASGSPHVGCSVNCAGADGGGSTTGAPEGAAVAGAGGCGGGGTNAAAILSSTDDGPMTSGCIG